MKTGGALILTGDRIPSADPADGKKIWCEEGEKWEFMNEETAHKP